MYYCSAFAPFSAFHKEHLIQLRKKQKVEQPISVLFLNDIMNPIKTKLYWEQIKKEVDFEIDYQQVTYEELKSLLLEENQQIYFDALLVKEKSELASYISPTYIMEIKEVYGYELSTFDQTFIFDDISQTLATYIIKNELFGISRNMGLIFNNMSYKRFQHTMRVRFLIQKLARLHGIDEEVAAFTALFHDYAKELSAEELFSIMEQYFPLYIDAPKPAWHGFAGALLLEQLYGADIVHDDIYEAIEFHPIGTPHYSKLGLALFIADFCDYRRSFKTETNYVWQLAQKDLYQAAQAKIESISLFFKETGKTLYWTTENMLKWLKETAEEKREEEKDE